MPRAVVWQQGSLQDLSLVLPVEAQLRPLIPSVAAAEAALWAAMADSGTLGTTGWVSIPPVATNHTPTSTPQLYVHLGLP